MAEVEPSSRPGAPPAPAGTAGTSVVDALVATYAPQLDAVAVRIDELKANQAQTLAALQAENKALAEAAELQFIADTMARIPTYQKRTADVCKEMVALHERIVRIKQRALRLAEKAQEDMTRSSERDRMLAAQPSAALRTAMEQDAQRETPEAQ